MTFDEPQKKAEFVTFDEMLNIARYGSLRFSHWKFDCAIEDKSTEHRDKLIKSGNFLAENQDV